MAIPYFDGLMVVCGTATGLRPRNDVFFIIALDKSLQKCIMKI